MKRLRALALAASLLALHSPANFTLAAEPFALTEVAPGLYVHRGVDEEASAANEDGIANIGFVVGKAAVAVIDPGGSLLEGKRLRAAIRATTSLPIRYVIMTHVHPDHIFGAAAFAPDKPVYVGHARLPGALQDRGEYYRKRLAETLGSEEAAGTVVVPTLLVDQQRALDLGGRILELDAHGAAHTDNDLTVFDRRTRTLWAADLLFVGRIPVVDGSLTGWLKELARLKTMPAARAIPGHGPVSVPWPAGAADEERYLQLLAREIRALQAKGGDMETAVETVGRSEREKWRLFDEYNGRNVTAAFKELEWE